MRKYQEHLTIRIDSTMREFLIDEADRQCTSVGSLMRRYIKNAIVDRMGEEAYRAGYEAEQTGQIDLEEAIEKFNGGRQ